MLVTEWIGLIALCSATAGSIVAGFFACSRLMSRAIVAGLQPEIEGVKKELVAFRRMSSKRIRKIKKQVDAHSVMLGGHANPSRPDITPTQARLA